MTRIKTSQSITYCQTVTTTRICRAETHTSFLFDHDPFRVPEVTQFPKRVPTRRQRALRVTRKSRWFADQLIRQPLVMNARRVDRVLNIHVVSMTFVITQSTVLIIVGPPGLPTVNHKLPSLRSTIVGVIAESGRFFGATAFRSPWISPYIFAVPGFAAKSSISSFRIIPVPLATAAEPYELFSV